MRALYTLDFKGVFSTYEDFKNEMNNLNPFDFVFNEIYLIYIYRVCYSTFLGYEIAYLDTQTFKEMFSLILAENYQKWEKELELIKKIRDLKDGEILTLNRTINNIALNPNTEILSDSEIIKYISSQATSNAQTSKLNAYLSFLSTLPIFERKKIIETFKDLFINIYVESMHLYNERNEWYDY